MALEKHDIFIGYNHNDLEFVQKLAEKLEKFHLSVWYCNTDCTASQTSDAILACKVFILVLTENSAEDQSLQEQLSLAYISDSSIYPLSKIRYRYLSPKLSGGAKLMLAKINWCFVLNMEEFETKTDTLFRLIQKDIDSYSSSQRDIYTTHGLTVSLSHLPEGEEEVGQTVDLTPLSDDRDFWDRHFEGQTEVSWRKFKTSFLSDYGAQIEETFSKSAEDKKNVFCHILYKDIFELGHFWRRPNQVHQVPRQKYEQFSQESGPHVFFGRVQQYVLAYISLKDVISMDSSLRISTIQRLGQYPYPAIISGLADMIKDEDPNIRAVAAIALAHAGKDRPATVTDILTLIEDEDRLVRESACLSLAYLRSTSAVPYIVDRWRNDPISTVREAAELALSKLETADAKRSMKVAQVLSSEMKALKPPETK